MARARILIVDDEKDMCWILSRVFADIGYEVVTTQSGKEAIAKVKEDHFHLVILDLRLKDISGIKVLSRLRSLAPKMQIIMISAFGTPEIKEATREMRVYEFIDKPFRVERILKSARKALEKV
ncbi:unnamed protein product, partial [marine sediment metagenome]